MRSKLVKGFALRTNWEGRISAQCRLKDGQRAFSSPALQTTEPSYESCCVGIRPPVVEDDTNALGKRSFPSLRRRRWRNYAVSAPNGCFAPSPPGRAARSAVGRVHSDSLRIRAAGEPPPSTVPSSRGTRPTDCLARPHFRAAVTVGQYLKIK